MHRVVALALPDVVALDLSIPAQVFGHAEERERYVFTVCTEHPGELPSTTGFSITVAHGLAALAEAGTVVVPGFMPTDDPPAVVAEALRRAYERGRASPRCASARSRSPPPACWTVAWRPHTGSTPMTCAGVSLRTGPARGSLR